MDIMTPQNNILIVDDENHLRLSLSLILQKENYLVETAADAEAALDCLRLHEYDLMFLDLNMPGTSGIDLLVEVHRQFPHVPVLILTAHAALESAIQAVRLGARDYLIKPVEPVLILTRVAAILLRENNLPVKRKSSARFKTSWLSYKSWKARIRLQPARWLPCHPPTLLGS